MRERTRSGFRYTIPGIALSLLFMANFTWPAILWPVLGVALIVLGLLRWWCGGLVVVIVWLKWRRLVPLRFLGGIIGETHDDMIDAGLAIRRPSSTKRVKHADGSETMSERDRGYRFPKMKTYLDPVGLRVVMTPIRAVQTQEDLIAALPQLRSAWGVENITAQAYGARDVVFRLHVGDPLAGTRDADIGPTKEDGGPWLTA